MRLTRYQEIILRDVKSPDYPKQKKWVWALFGFFGAVFLTIHLVFFQPGLRRFLGFLVDMYRYSLVTNDTNFKTAVYVYQYLLLFFAFAGFAAVFAVFALLAYDMQARNGIIRQLLNVEEMDENAAAASKKATS